MGSCVAYGCTNTFSKKIPGITFHVFPKNEERKSLWVQAVRRENWKPTKASKLCSAHFHEDVIDRTSLAVVRLRENAVPTLFESSFPMQSQGTGSKRRRLKETAMPSQKLPLLSTESKEMILKTSKKTLTTGKCTLNLNKKEVAKTGRENDDIDSEEDDKDSDYSESFSSDEILKRNDFESISSGENLKRNNDSGSISSGENLKRNDDFESLTSEEILKRELGFMTALYEKSQKKLKLCQEQCKHYIKQVITLEQVIDNLKQINSVSDYS